MRRSLVLFARVPRPGRVKTRLAARLTAAGAASLYGAFLEDAARLYLAPGRWESVLAVDGDPGDPLLDPLFPPVWRRRRQAPGDLGDRLRDAFEGEFRRGSAAVVAVGSDHPALPRSRLEGVFDCLGAGDAAALVPAEDGGYCAIGLAAGTPVARVFAGVPWSTSRTLAETVARLSAAGLRLSLLEPAWDVDRPEDLDRLRRDLTERDALAEDYPAATARALEALERDGR